MKATDKVRESVRRAVRRGEELVRRGSREARGGEMVPVRRTGRSGAMLAPFGGIESGNPFRMMRRFMEDMDRLFEDFYGQKWGPGSGLEAMGIEPWAPEVEVFARDGKLVVKADVPGLSKNDLSIEVQHGVLTISGERKEEREERRGGYYVSERSYGRFSRTIPLPEGVREDGAQATYENGVLEIELPAPGLEERRGRRIEIGTGELGSGASPPGPQAA